MTVTIHPIADAPGTYLAYTLSPGARATYFAYFTEDIGGTLTLSNFVQMLQKHFDVSEIDVAFRNTDFQMNNETFWGMLHDRF